MLPKLQPVLVPHIKKELCTFLKGTCPTSTCYIISPSSVHFLPLTFLQDRMDVLMKRAQMGDWFLIYLLSKNLDSLMFKEFIIQLTGELKKDA